MPDGDSCDVAISQLENILRATSKGEQAISGLHMETAGVHTQCNTHTGLLNDLFISDKTDSRTSRQTRIKNTTRACDPRYSLTPVTCLQLCQ